MVILFFFPSSDLICSYTAQAVSCQPGFLPSESLGTVQHCHKFLVLNDEADVEFSLIV